MRGLGGLEEDQVQAFEGLVEDARVAVFSAQEELDLARGLGPPGVSVAPDGSAPVGSPTVEETPPEILRLSSPRWRDQMAPTGGMVVRATAAKSDTKEFVLSYRPKGKAW